MNFDDMICFMTDEEIQEKLQNFRQVDLTDINQKWLAVSYIYACNNGLKDYQAKSFASVFTLFVTGEMFPSEVEHIYREDWLDAYLLKKFDEILEDCDDEKDDLFWARFKGFIIAFYKSDYCLHFERVRHQLNVRLSDEEYEMFQSVPAEKNIDKFIFLLREFDKGEGTDFVRKGDISRQIVFKFGESAYDLLMSVPVERKTSKFLACLYQYHH